MTFFSTCGNAIYEAEAEYYAQLLWSVCYSYQHSDFAFASSFGDISVHNNVKETIPEGAVGINPKVLLATLLGENRYGTTGSSLFGDLSSVGAGIVTDPDTMKREFESQLNEAVVRYIRFFYFAPYYQVHFPHLYSRGDAHGTGGGSYVPVNSAMFSQGQYCTEGLRKIIKWQEYFRSF